MTVYHRNPLLMTVMGANPGGPAFIVADSITGRVMYTKRATGVGSQAINSCAAVAQRLANRNGRSYIVFLDMSRARVGGEISVPWARRMGITEEIHPDGSVTRGNRVNRNPGFGEAIIAGATGALVNRALQSNPEQEGGPCPTCSGSLAYQGTLGNREHYRCRNCGMDFSTPVTHRRRYRGWKKTCGHGEITNNCRRCRGRRVDPRIRPCPHGIAGGGVRCVACQRLYRRGGPVQNNPAISRSWNSLKSRPRLAILEFAGIPPEQASRLAGRAWETLPPSIQTEVSKGWQENSGGLRPKKVKVYCVMCGEWLKSKGPYHVMKVGPQKGKKLCDLCYRGIRSGRRSGESWAQNPQANPGSKRRLTMTIEKFAQWVKAKRDPVMWKAFLAKFRGYEKWTHGAKAKKVTVEWVDTPGVNGLWITYDGGKQPESTYIMPKGVPRKGAWKHPWDTMPDIKHDPEAKIVITKLRGQSKITDFYHK